MVNSGGRAARRYTELTQDELLQVTEDQIGALVDVEVDLECEGENLSPYYIRIYREETERIIRCAIDYARALRMRRQRYEEEVEHYLEMLDGESPEIIAKRLLCDRHNDAKEVLPDWDWEGVDRAATEGQP